MSRATTPHESLASVEEQQTPSASEVVHALIGASHVIGRLFDARLAAHKLPVHLSGPRLRIFMAVEHAGQLRMGDLAAVLGITPRTVTTLVDALEREGLLVRLPDPADRRATLLEITPVARAHVKQVHAIQRQLSEEVVAALDAMSDQEAARTLITLSQLASAEFYLDLFAEGAAHITRSLELARATKQAELFPMLAPLCGIY
ncbi:MAG TPA: MarR family winged helix-turn-helix transcriptional regulator, partial [Ktedonobacterales bacterium]|nr:MarR family winged helix-turn-helix transcriptional regulator [Ktedonobacterales bacterium]